MRGFIEKVKDINLESDRVHYIPHHPVKTDSSTTPIRIVYDCSCQQSADSPCLNDCLEPTPPEVTDISDILIRFRNGRYAVSSDIEKAFLHIQLDEKDRDVTRFLWLSEPSNPDSPLCTYRFKAVLFGCTSSPFILNATLLNTKKTTTRIECVCASKMISMLTTFCQVFQKKRCRIFQYCTLFDGICRI